MKKSEELLISDQIRLEIIQEMLEDPYLSAVKPYCDVPDWQDVYDYGKQMMYMCRDPEHTYIYEFWNKECYDGIEAKYSDLKKPVDEDDLWKAEARYKRWEDVIRDKITPRMDQIGNVLQPPMELEQYTFKDYTAWDWESEADMFGLYNDYYEPEAVSIIRFKEKGK